MRLSAVFAVGLSVVLSAASSALAAGPSDHVLESRPYEFTLRYRDAYINAGSGATVDLKQSIYQVYGNVDLGRYDVQSVTLLAKSRYGETRVNLAIGSSSTFDETIRGNPRDFDNPSSYTFQSVYLSAPANTSSPYDNWYMNMRGSETVVREIRISVRDRYNGPGPGPGPNPGDPNYPPSGSLIGQLDGVYNDGQIAGWACDRSNSYYSIAIRFYVDGPSGQGRYAGSANTSYDRSDVRRIYPECNGSHGFAFQIPYEYRDGRRHTLA